MMKQVLQYYLFHYIQRCNKLWSAHRSTCRMWEARGVGQELKHSQLQAEREYSPNTVNDLQSSSTSVNEHTMSQLPIPSSVDNS